MEELTGIPCVDTLPTTPPAAAGRQATVPPAGRAAALPADKETLPADAGTLSAAPADRLIPCDSSATLADTPALFADSLAAADPAMFPAADTLPATTASDLFGPASTRAGHAVPAAAGYPTLTQALPFQGAALTLALLYLFFVGRHLHEARTLLAGVAAETLSGRRIFDNRTGGYFRFLNGMSFLGTLSIALFAAKLFDLLPPAMCAALPAPLALLFVPAVIVGIAVIALCQFAALRTIGELTLMQELTEGLLLLKRTHLALGALIVAPPLTFYALSARDEGRLWLYLSMAEIVAIVLLFLWKSLGLFLAKKISILHWFLYFCTVEMFPVSLLWLLLVKA